ncbi:TPA: hypothetical protein EYP26_05960 [Candidatus Bathyarchaeota archaeon]|nr:hypothetical protein [Candidatus Bathyarchaeota archaeon]
MAEIRGAKFCPECGRPLKPSRRLFIATILLLSLLAASNLWLFWLLQAYRAQAESRIAALTGNLEEAKKENERLAGQVSSLQAAVESLRGEAGGLRSELSRYKLRRPSIEELKAFLAADRTDEREFVEGVYDCKSFARDLRSAAKAQGLNLSYAIVDFEYWHFGWERGGHIMNGAWLADGGWAWIEPQGDDVIRADGPNDWSELESFLSEEWEVKLRVTQVVVVW